MSSSSGSSRSADVMAETVPLLGSGSRLSVSDDDGGPLSVGVVGGER